MMSIARALTQKPLQAAAPIELAGMDDRLSPSTLDASERGPTQSLQIPDHSTTSDPGRFVVPHLAVEDLARDASRTDAPAEGRAQLALMSERAPVPDLTAHAHWDAAGSTAIVTSAAKPVFTTQQIADQLTDGFWEHLGGARRAFDVAAGGVLNVDLSDLTAAGRNLAVAALQAWTDVTGIRFNTRPGSGNVDIAFDDWDSGSAWSSSGVFGSTIYYSDVNVGRDWLQYYGTGAATYSFQTYIHEIGHALGLGHAGNYNGTATYGIDNQYRNDSWQASVMSYFSQLDNTYVNASEAYVVSPMIADILAIRELYDTPALRTGNTVYGEHSDAGGNYTRIANLLASDARDRITFTIVDDGGIDTLDLSGDTRNQRIVMAQQGISDAYGLIGNISIASGTMIENLRAGSGSDRVAGNAANNTIWGNNGNDALNGGGGNDTLIGGAGSDTLMGNIGNDVYHVDSRDTIIDVANGGRDLVHAAFSMTLGAHLEDLRLTGTGAVNGTGNIAANSLQGNTNANQLRGMAGNDTLAGSGGNDSLWGGAGADVFVFDNGRDRVYDFQNDVDTIRIDDVLWGGATRSVAQLLAAATIVDGDAVFRFGPHSLTIEHVTNVQSLADDLIIV